MPVYQLLPGLSALLARFEAGIDTRVASNRDSISLGQKQLIAFVRAVLRRPELLILDEATANIDTVTEQLLEAILARLPGGTTKVIIAHRLNTIKSADEILFVNAGKVLRAVLRDRGAWGAHRPRVWITLRTPHICARIDAPCENIAADDFAVDVRLISTLASGEIHLWLASDDVGDERLHCAYRELLSDCEREQERRFHFSRDRRRYLVTRALVRTVLSRYCPIDPREWLFSKNAYGRPEIANAACSELGLEFNVSHTYGGIVLAVTVHRAIGVDIERVVKREAIVDIADRFFAPVEVVELAAIPRDQRQDRFFEYWTFKESYIKARGMGLSLPLEKFSFHYPSDRSVCISIDPELADDPARWQFWQFRPTPDYLVALCAERSAAPADIVVWETVPMASERTVVLESIRTSSAASRERGEVCRSGAT